MGIFHQSSELGALGEELAVRYLKEKGYRILGTNYCNTYGRRLGEIDIVAQKEEELIFVEVKSRLQNTEGVSLPEAGITRDKLRKLDRIAQHYLREKGWEMKAYHFDAVAVLYDQRLRKASIRHIEHIFF